ncbi:hypothetical protein BDZ89DRAFT_1160884 [Hymenopellis radicata]|nr:hypothetical protein BDZ89DRAFT_1160884 [Hymenopellis radicata]
MALEDGRDSMITVITPLNLLGKQNAKVLNDANLSALAVNADNSEPSTYEDIRQGKYQVIVLGPELARDKGFQGLLEDASFQSRLLYVVIDEAHCVSQWGRSFREDYLHVGHLRDFLPDHIPFFAASATLPLPILNDVAALLQLRSTNTERIILSNDRSNVHLCVREIKHAVASFEDLVFLIPEHFKNYKEGDPPPMKFLIFCNSIRETEDAIHYLRKRLPPEYSDKLKWFHATMSSTFRDEEFNALRTGDVWGMAVTDAFGMGMDLPDIKIVVQWRTPRDMCILWQRFGRAGRDLQSPSFAILMADKADFDAARKRKADAAQKAAESRKRKADSDTNDRPSKRRRPLGDLNGATPSSSNSPSLPHATLKRSKGDRRVFYHQDPISTIKGSGKRKKEPLLIGGPVDDMINASGREINCRREPPMLLFGNDQLANDYHLKCDPSNPEGCTRCRPRKSAVCCDLCTPDAFLHFITVMTAKESIPGRSRLGKYEYGSKDLELKAALLDWRDDVAHEVLEHGFLADYGSEMFMSNETLHRIVDCAHWKKIEDANQLYRETRWPRKYVTAYATALLSIITRIWPLPAPEPEPDSLSVVPIPVKPVRHCGVCGGPGHNRKNRACPEYYTKGPGAIVATENTPPTTPRHAETFLPLQRLVTPLRGEKPASHTSVSFRPSLLSTPTPGPSHSASTPSVPSHTSESSPLPLIFLNFNPSNPYPESLN